MAKKSAYSLRLQSHQFIAYVLVILHFLFHNERLSQRGNDSPTSISPRKLAPLNERLRYIVSKEFDLLPRLSRKPSVPRIQIESNYLGCPMIAV